MTPTIQIPSPWLTMSMSYRISASIRSALSWFCVAAIALVVSIFAPALSTTLSYLAYAPWVALGVLALALYTTGMTFFTTGSVRYQLCEDEIRYESGIFSRKAISLPYDRIQTVSITSGVIERLLGISHVVCQSAADQSNITLPGLRTEQAELTREAITERARRSRSGGRDTV